ncbi:MAG: hypothetical protein KGL40_05470 [Rhodocyclaceae bacterium]|nr:hypothetical protein [Rhodocyclaceae bacterium]
MAKFGPQKRFSTVGVLTDDTLVMGKPASVWQETFAGKAFVRNLESAKSGGKAGQVAGSGPVDHKPVNPR